MDSVKGATVLLYLNAPTVKPAIKVVQQMDVHQERAAYVHVAVVIGRARVMLMRLVIQLPLLPQLRHRLLDVETVVVVLQLATAHVKDNALEMETVVLSMEMLVQLQNHDVLVLRLPHV